MSFPYKVAGKENLPDGFTTLPIDVQKALLAQEKLETIEAEIEQLVIQGSFREKRRGYFWANHDGKFRIQYFLPNELVVFDGKNLYWYIPENGFSWVLPAQEKKKFYLPTEKNWLTSKSRITYEKPWWAKFFPESNVVFFLEQDGFELKLIFSRKLGQVVERVSYQNQKIIYEESFENLLNCDNKPFFAVVKVKAFEGKYSVYSETTYKNPRCNKKLSEDLFKKPLYPVRQYAIP